MIHNHKQGLGLPHVSALNKVARSVISKAHHGGFYTVTMNHLPVSPKIFGHNQVLILVFPCPTSYRLTLIGFSLLQWGIFCKLLWTWSLEHQTLIFHTQNIICNYTLVSPFHFHILKIYKYSLLWESHITPYHTAIYILQMGPQESL